MNTNISKQNVLEKLYFDTIKQETISENEEEIPRYNMISVKKQKTS